MMSRFSATVLLFNHGKLGRLMIRISVFCFCCLFTVLPSSTTAQTGHENHGGGPVPRSILEMPVGLRQGIGKLHEKVSTTSPDAQAFYDQGLAYLHSFVWIEAIRSFHQALRLDPKMGMAFLRLSEAYIGLQDVQTARSAFQRAADLTASLTDRERTWIDIYGSEIALAESNGDLDKYAEYRKSINRALKSYPSDPWFWIQRGLADEGTVFSHGQAGGADTLAFYRTALSLAPNNLAARHYYAHTLENLGKTKEALEETENYLREAPAIPHAHHMRGHELTRLGRTEEAIAEFLKTKSLEDEYYRIEKIPARYDWHHAHNLQLLAMCYESLGQIKAAETAFRESYATPGYTEFLEFNRKDWPEFLLARGRYQEALEVSQELSQSPWVFARLAGHTLSGMALLATHKVEDAVEQLHLAEQDTEQLPLSVVATSQFPTTLRAALLLRNKQTEEGDSILRDLSQAILARPGPDAWSASRFELDALAATARQNGEWDLSELIANEIIAHDPAYGGGYFAVGLAEEHRGASEKAKKAYREAQARWAKADAELLELKHIQEFLGRVSRPN